LLLECGMALAGQRRAQVFDHCPRAGGDLEIVPAAGQDLAEREMYENLPVRRPKIHAQTSRVVEDAVGSQVPLPDQAKHTMELVDGENGSRRIVDGRR